MLVPFHPGDLRVDDPGDGGNDGDSEEQTAARGEFLGQTQKEEFGGEEVALQA